MEAETLNYSTLNIAYEERSPRFRHKWTAYVFLKHPQGKTIEFADFGHTKEEARANLIAAVRRSYELEDDAERDTVESVPIDWKM